MWAFRQCVTLASLVFYIASLSDQSSRFFAPLSGQHSFHTTLLTAATLEKHCLKNTQKQQLLILNSPNNPSGACFSKQELKALAKIAAKYHIFILSDESKLNIGANKKALNISNADIIKAMKINIYNFL